MKRREPASLKHSDPSPSRYYPFVIGLCVVIFCLAPLLDFSMANQWEPFAIEQLAHWQLREEHLRDEMFYTLAGGFTHALLEWASVVVAMCCILLAFSHYSISKDLTAPVIALALTLAAGLDGLHTLAATRLIDSTIENKVLIPFTCSLSAGLYGNTLLIGLTLLLAYDAPQARKPPIFALAAFGIVTSAACLLTAKAVYIDGHIPELYVTKNSAINVYDLYPIVALLASIVVASIYYRNTKNFLILWALAGSALKLMGHYYAVFHSENNFDHFFNAAHVLNLLSYILPIFGFILDLRNSHQYHQRVKDRALLKAQIEIDAFNNYISQVNFNICAGLIIVDAHGDIEYANPFATNIFRFQEDGLLGLNIKELVPAGLVANEDPRPIAWHDSDPIQYHSATDDWLEGIASDGRHIPLKLSTSSISSKDQTHTLITINDMSEIAELTMDLERNNAKMYASIKMLNESNDRLKRFASACSHDLKEPLRMINSFVQLLTQSLGKDISTEQQRYIEHLQTGAERGLKIVKDMLTLSHLDAANKDESEVRLASLLEEVKRTLHSQLIEANGSITWDKTCENSSIRINEGFLFQILLNVCSNGIRFNQSTAPRITISGHLKNGFLSLQVKDNGIGIKPEYQEKVFDLFCRLHSQAEYPGTGTGLSICRQIAEALDIELSLHSQVGQYTCVSIKIPKARMIEKQEQLA